MNTNNIVMWEILPNNADWDCIKTLISREILKIQNPFLEEIAVSHSSTESEIISLDTGLRLDGLPAVELWDLILFLSLENISREKISDRSVKPESDDHKHHKSHNKSM